MNCHNHADTKDMHGKYEKGKGKNGRTSSFGLQ